MLDEKRIRQMTKLAEFEQRQGDDIEKIRTYYRSDYISVHMLKNLLRILAVFAIGFALWFCYDFENVMEMLNKMNIMGLGLVILFVFGVVVIAFMILSYALYSYRYYQDEQKFQAYRNMLQRLVAVYDMEESGQSPRMRRRRRARGGRDDDSIVRF